MSRDGSLPPGVEHSDGHFNPPVCRHCGEELGEEGCIDVECDGHGDPEADFAEPDWDSMPGGADDDDRMEER